MPTTTTRDRLGRRARFAAAVVVLVSGSLFVASLLTAHHDRLPTGGGLGADYLAFYDAGDVLRRYGPARLYDLPLQSAEYHARLPGEPPDAFLPYAYAPHVAVPFAVLSELPYARSYVAWTTMSIAAYAIAVVLAIRAAALPKAWWPTAGWLAASFEPFAFECVHGGQISTVATALLSAAALLSIAGRPFAAGLVVGCCCYKPTLLVILVPGLLVTRRWVPLAGCAVATLGWCAIDLLAFGVGPCRMYLTLLTGYAGHGALDFRLWKFVDVHSFVLLLGGSQGVATAAAVVVMMVAIIGLRRHRVRAVPMGRVSTVDERPFGTAAARHADGDRLFWAAVLAWTPVANLYAGAYDAVLAVPAALLVAGELRRRRGRLSTAYIATVAAVWLTPWFTSLAARATGVQLLTIAMAALGTFTVRPGRRTLVGGDWPARRPATSPFQVWPVQLAPSARWIDGPPENPVRG